MLLETQSLLWLRKLTTQSVFDAAAKITSGKKDVALADLKTDAKVAVSYKVVDGKKVASKIKEVVATPAKAKKAKAAADAAAPATEPAAK